MVLNIAKNHQFSSKSSIFMDFADFGWYELGTPGYELYELEIKKYENSKVRKT